MVDDRTGRPIRKPPSADRPGPTSASALAHSYQARRSARRDAGLLTTPAAHTAADDDRASRADGRRRPRTVPLIVPSGGDSRIGLASLRPDRLRQRCQQRRPRNCPLVAEQPSHRRAAKGRDSCSKAKASGRVDRFSASGREAGGLCSTGVASRAGNSQDAPRSACRASRSQPADGRLRRRSRGCRRATRRPRPRRQHLGGLARSPGSCWPRRWWPTRFIRFRRCVQGLRSQSLTCMATSGRLPGDPVNAPGYAPTWRRREPSDRRGAPALSGG